VQVSHPFRELQKYYVVIGAAFIPLLALVLLVLNGRRRLVGAQRNRAGTVVILVLVLALALAAAVIQVRAAWT
jgi:hypothetical protein